MFLLGILGVLKCKHAYRRCKNSRFKNGAFLNLALKLNIL
jgi:hypothetical protein